MANRVQTLRSATGGARPAAGSRLAGELYVNWPDKQIGVIDSTQNPLDLVGVRFFSTGASYNVGDYTVQGGQLYRANASITPSAFTAAQWDQVMTTANAAGTYLPLTGGTLAGPGTLTVNGTATFGSTMSVTGLTTVNNQVVSKGALASFASYDRGSSGGDTTKAFQLYRDANIGRLWMMEAGDVLSFATTGNATFGHLLTCTAGLTVNGSTSLANTSIVGTASTPLSVTVPAGLNAAIYTATSGQHGWLAGAWTDGSYYLYDNSVGTRFYIDTGGNTYINPSGGNTACYGVFSANYASHYPIQVNSAANMNAAIQFTPAGQYQWLMGPVASVGTNTCYAYCTSSGGARMMWANTYTNGWGNMTLGIGPNAQINIGATGAYEINGAILVSPQSSGNGAGGAISCYGATQWSTNLRSRVDSTAAYPAYFLYGTTGVGWITTDGANVYYSTACDARRKTGIRPLASELDVGALIDALTPCAFDWQEVRFKTPGTVEPTEDPDVVNRTEGVEVITQPPRSHGFLAQELQAVVPSIVTRGNLSNDEEELLGADYSKLVPYLVAELQTLRKRVAELERSPKA